jgi:hypothetical protein
LKKLALCIGLLMYSRQVAKASTITFDDGTVGGTIGTFYASLGITFSNASWAFPPPGFQIGASTGLLLEDLTDNGFNPPYSPTSTTPIVGIFSSPQDFISILGVDVGAAGMELDAYGAGENLLGSPEFYGTGAGLGVYQTLSVSAPGVVRFDLFQPTPNRSDGLAFDNLTFNADPPTPVPEDVGIEPGTWILLGSGLLALVVAGYLKRLKLRPPAEGRLRVYANRAGS